MPKLSPLPLYRTRRRWTEKEARAALAALAVSRLCNRSEVGAWRDLDAGRIVRAARCGCRPPRLRQGVRRHWRVKRAPFRPGFQRAAASGGFHRWGSSSSIRLAGCECTRVSTSVRYAIAFTSFFSQDATSV